MRRVWAMLLAGALILSGCGVKEQPTQTEEPSREKPPAELLEVTEETVSDMELAASCAEAYKTITEDMTFLISVEEADGTATILDITPDNAWNVRGQENTFAYKFVWSAAEQADWEDQLEKGGYLLTMADADSKAMIQCCSEGDVVCWRQGGGNVTYAQAVNPKTETDSDEWTFYQFRLTIAQEAAVEDIWSMTVDGGETDLELVARQLAEQAAENYRALPSWVRQKPQDMKVSGINIFDIYRGEPENFCCGMGFRVLMDDPARMYWEAGSGLGDPEEDGYYGWGGEAHIKKNERGDWYCDGLATGGSAVELPFGRIDTAPLEQLIDAFYLTEGFTHDWRIPYYILELSEEELKSLPSLLDQRTEQEVKALCAALSSCLRQSAHENWTLETLKPVMGAYDVYLDA